MECVMVAPKPYKLKCPCGYSKIVAPRSDALSPVELMATNSTCSKCGKTMQKIPLNPLEQILEVLKK